MKKIFWIAVILFLYFWIVSPDRGQRVLEQGKHIFEEVLSWFDDSDIDFHVQQKPSENSKKSRNWD